MRTNTIRAASALLAAALAACAGGGSDGPSAPRCSVTAVTVSPGEGTLRVGDALPLTATVAQSGCAGLRTTWSSSNAAVAAVSPAGTVTALAPGGPVTITASVEDRTASATLMVTAPAPPTPTPPTPTAPAPTAPTPAPPTPPAAVAAVSVAPATLTLTVGQTGTLAASVRDAQGAALSGRLVAWTTSNAAAATVSASGVVTAVAAGQSVVTATSEGRSGSATVVVTAPAPAPARQVTLEVTNQLLYPVNIAVGGATIGSVSAQSTQVATVTSAAVVRVAWTLVRPTLGGRVLGDAMSGYWDLAAPSGTVRLTVDNVVGGEPYFAPVVTNTSATALLMAANWGLQSESRCQCTVPPTGTPTVFGYYRLFSNSTLAAFRSGSNYTGGYRLFSNFASGVPRGSGRTPFTASVAP